MVFVPFSEEKFHSRILDVLLLLQGSDCVNPFVALQSCINANPDAFSKSVTGDEKETEKKEEQPPVQDHRIIPPLWAKDPPRSGNSKL
jgi:intermembrane space import and assembly protein 40